MRAGEFTVKSNHPVEDMAVDSHISPSMTKVHLKQSKTDPFRHSVDIFLGRTDASLCPVAAILAYCAIRPTTAAGPLFMFRDSSPLTRDRPSSCSLECPLSGRCQYCSLLRSQLSGGSRPLVLREATIKMLGRWESAAYEGYVRTPRETPSRHLQTVVKGSVSWYLKTGVCLFCVHAGR